MIKFYREGIMKNIVPLMLCVSIVASCMYVYSRTYLALLVLITIVIQTTTFSFYTYISKKSLILRFISILGSFFAITGMVVIAVKTGNNKSFVDYFLWFLSPQALVDFSAQYIAATFIIINFFIASTVFYFSAVRYRISMTFLITLIPFAVYRKEVEQVPVFFALLLLVMYMALMIHCRQINLKPRQKMIIDRGYKKSMVVFLACSSLLALAFPKPEITVDNSWVDTVFESERITDYMLKRLGIVTETASSSITYTGSANVKLYEFMADEPVINLKSQTYSNYDFKTNLWRAARNEISGPQIDETDAEMLSPAEFYRAVAGVSAADSSFAKKYSLDNLAPELPGDYTRRVSMVSSRVPSKFYYVPVLAWAVDSTAGTNNSQGSSVMRTQHGMFYSATTSGTSYSIRYYSDASAYDKNMRRLITSLDFSSFGDFLDDLQKSAEDNGLDEYQDIITVYRNDYEAAMEYYEESFTEIPDSVYEITDKAVRKKSSDIEKAEAIESYFNLHDFVYSISYKKPEGYNMEYFLTEGKTGLCSDYATAMVLMARAAGIPARYAEGIHLHDPDEYGIITVTDSDLHAFPELYIAGYGWKSFEPTQLGTEQKPAHSFDIKMSAVFAMTAAFLIIFVLFYDRLIGPYISEKIFRIRLKKAENEKSLEMIFIRLRKKLGLENSVTAAEMAGYVADVYGTDMSGTADNIDRVIYGGEKAEESAKASAAGIYEQITEILKNEKKKRKMRKF